MDTASSDDGSAVTASAAPRRTLLLGLLLTLGSLAVIAGTISVASANAAANVVIAGSSGMPTLPVHTYAQYTQRLAVPDQSGLWTGSALVALGVAVLMVWAAVLVTRPRTA
ncbi:hypothetical protein AB4Z18_00490 [Leifsonia sp. 2TAF2]|uniref:hypothetical protein n=1 Tax=Leifsonia sp. 2TAF2 TaxID=3233009 RepID=UPI003F9C2CA8